jgi:hypothetical protein
MIEAFPIPDFVTPEWYLAQKELNKNDAEIASELFISKPLLDKWKQQRGCKVGQRGGRKPKIAKEEVKAMLDKDIPCTEIAKALGVTTQAIYYIVNTMGWEKSKRSNRFRVSKLETFVRDVTSIDTSGTYRTRLNNNYGRKRQAEMVTKLKAY